MQIRTLSIVIVVEMEVVFNAFSTVPHILELGPGVTHVHLGAPNLHMWSALVHVGETKSLHSP